MKKYLSVKNLTAFLVCFLTSFSSVVQAAPLSKISGVPTKSVGDILDSAIGWILTFGVTVCILALIWGGVSYVWSLGNQETAQKGKKVITYAILGLLIMGLSYAIIVIIDSVVVNP